MQRDAMARLVEWKSSRKRKPLIVYGARQVGKTWLVQEFGSLHFSKTAYVVMTENTRMAALFASTTDAKTLISGLEAEVGFSIDASDTLIFLDEIQEVPKALAALKYLYEQAPQYHIIAAGSMLGVAIHAVVSFPVGKVNSLTIGPMSFAEFLRADKGDAMADLLSSRDPVLLQSFHLSLNEYLKQYLIIGGMPEVVQSFVDEHDYIQSRRIQRQILDDYDRDFGKHAPLNVVPRIRMVWNSIPSQLARENKKFIYGTIKKGARAREFELAIQWLADAGLVSRVQRVNKVAVPLKHYEDPGAFKLFLVDVGLHGAMANVEPRIILEDDKLLTEFKGAFTEQYVAQQLLSRQPVIYFYSSDDAKVELDFVVEACGAAVPIEVKSATGLQSKSLTHFINKHSIQRAVKFSLRPEHQGDVIFNEPLYLAERFGDLIDG